jgi:hypothetical protein
MRVKYHLFRSGASGLALAGEARLPTGSEQDLIGAGRTSLTPRVIGSYENGRVGIHGELGYSFREESGTVGYAVAATIVAASRLTLVGELSGLRLNGLARLTETTRAHPRLVGVDTIRLTGVDQTTDRILAVAGVKWNIANTWLLTANVRRPVTEVGLNAGWVPTITLDYAFGR